MTTSVHYSPASLNKSYSAPEIMHQRERTLAALSVDRGQTALDAGCGTGLLSVELCRLVGDSGRVIAIDKSGDMVEAARSQCASYGQFSASQGDIGELSFTDEYFDLVTCTQVLLYVEDVQHAIGEMARVLKPGGRLAILETDWRTAIMHSNYPDITDSIYRAWDATVPSPNLPVRMKKLMTDSGIESIHVEAIPLINTEFDPTSFSVSSLDWLSGNACKQGAIDRDQASRWRDDLADLGQNGAYFFCVNRFLFCGSKT